jgi:signal transduction histidine kinase
MSIVAEIARLHGAALQIESKLNEGTTVQVLFMTS